MLSLITKLSYSAIVDICQAFQHLRGKTILRSWNRVKLSIIPDNKKKLKISEYTYQDRKKAGTNSQSYKKVIFFKFYKTHLKPPTGETTAAVPHPNT